MTEIVAKLDRLVRWGYNARRIDGKLLEGFQEVIRDLSAADPAPVAVTETLSRFTGEINSLSRALSLSGITPKGMEAIAAVDDDFIVLFEKRGFALNTELRFIAFLSMARWQNLFCENDMGNIAYYMKLWGWACRGDMEKFRPYLQFMRDLCPHLGRYFDRIENLQPVDMEEANNEMYQYHLNN